MDKIIDYCITTRVNLHFSFFSSRTHSVAIYEAPVKFPVSFVCQVEDLFEIFSEALQRGQAAAVLQHDRVLTRRDEQQ